MGALKTDLELVIDILGESIQAPLFLDRVVAKEKQFQVAAIKAEADQPFTMAMNRFRKEMFGHHPYGLPDKGTPETISSFSPKQLASFREELITGSNGVIGVFGDLDPSEAEGLIRSRFEAIPRGLRQFFR